MQNSQQTAERIKLLAKTNKIPISKLTLDCGLNKNALYTMQSKEFYPRVETIEKIADYLNCSIDYLLGRSDIVENRGLSKDEQDMINRFRRLNPQGQEYILSTMDAALVLYKNTEADLKLVANKPVSVPAIVKDELRHT